MTHGRPVDYMVVFDRYTEEVPRDAINPDALHVAPLWMVGLNWGLWTMASAIQFAIEHGTEPPATPPILHANFVEEELVLAGPGDRSPGVHLRCRRMWHGTRYVRVSAEAYSRASGPDRPFLNVHAVLEEDRMATEPRLTDLVRLISGPIDRHRPVVGMQVVALGANEGTGEVDAAWDQITRGPGDGRR